MFKKYMCNVKCVLSDLTGYRFFYVLQTILILI